jgi:glycosyltransferase involved in cell wall biosynthesis
MIGIKLQKKPMVSVITSVFNGEKFLAESILSILEQSFQDFELIIVDDASIDSSSEIIENYMQLDERIRLIINTKNIGLTKSLNKAIATSKGIYIARIDADDVAMPMRLESQIKFLEKNIDIGLVGTATYLIDSNGVTIDKISYPETNEILKKTLIKHNPFDHSSIMVRKDVFDRIGLYNEKNRYSQDYELYFRISRYYMMANMPKYLMKKRYVSSMLSLKNESEQKRFAIMARFNAIKIKQYPVWCGIYLVKPYLVMKTPMIIRRVLRQYLLPSKRIYQILEKADR